MNVIVKDNRVVRDEFPVVCTQCSFPEIELIPEVESLELDRVRVEGTPVKIYKPHKLAYFASAPTSEEEAVKMGWLETELGILCPLCAGPVRYQDALDIAEGSESHVGTGNMATALAQNIAESQGETFEGQIEDLPLATPHVLQLEGTGHRDDTGQHFEKGTATCLRCHKVWSFTATSDNNDFQTDPRYDRMCPVEMTPGEVIPEPIHKLIEENK